MKTLLLGAAALAALTVATAVAQPVEKAIHYGKWGFDASGEDPSVKAGDDFFAYANGGWDKRTEIPADRVRVDGDDEVLRRHGRGAHPHHHGERRDGREWAGRGRRD